MHGLRWTVNSRWPALMTSTTPRLRRCICDQLNAELVRFLHPSVGRSVSIQIDMSPCWAQLAVVDREACTVRVLTSNAHPPTTQDDPKMWLTVWLASYHTVTSHCLTSGYFNRTDCVVGYIHQYYTAYFTIWAFYDPLWSITITKGRRQSL